MLGTISLSAYISAYLTRNLTLGAGDLEQNSAGVPTHKYIIRDVEGLGLPPSTISKAEFGTSDGSFFLASRVPERNIVITVGFNPNYAIGETVAKLRRDLYALARPGQRVQMTFAEAYLGPGTSTEWRNITGYVETHEPVVFAKDPTVKISFICTEPFFEGGYDSITGSNTYDFTYAGDVDTGLDLSITMRATGSSVRLTNAADGASLGIVGSYVANDVIRFITKPGGKRVYRTGPSGSGDFIGGIIYDSTWPMLKPGRNVLTVSGSISNPASSGTLGYYKLYGGF